MTDCLKHAFVDGRQGRMLVDLRKVNGHIALRVEDDGIGLPADFDPDDTKGFGMVLVTMLSGRLGGSFSAKAGNGSRLILELPASGAGD